MDEFKQGCEGLCLLGGACRMVGRWLEEHETPKTCEIKQFQWKGHDYCVAYLTNERVARIIYNTDKVKEYATYDRVLHVTTMTLECRPDYISADIPVPLDETEFWQEELKKLHDELETLYISATHFHAYTNHLHFTYRDITPSGFRKVMKFIERVRTETPKK